eukprot:3463898-Rhodomonas_salina.2
MCSTDTHFGCSQRFVKAIKDFVKKYATVRGEGEKDNEAEVPCLPVCTLCNPRCCQRVVWRAARSLPRPAPLRGSAVTSRVLCPQTGEESRSEAAGEPPPRQGAALGLRPACSAICGCPAARAGRAMCARSAVCGAESGCAARSWCSSTPSVATCLTPPRWTPSPGTPSAHDWPAARSCAMVRADAACGAGRTSSDNTVAREKAAALAKYNKGADTGYSELTSFVPQAVYDSGGLAGAVLTRVTAPATTAISRRSSPARGRPETSKRTSGGGATGATTPKRGQSTRNLMVLTRGVRCKRCLWAYLGGHASADGGGGRDGGYSAGVFTEYTEDEFERRKLRGSSRGDSARSHRCSLARARTHTHTHTTHTRAHTHVVICSLLCARAIRCPVLRERMAGQRLGLGAPQARRVLPVHSAPETLPRPPRQDP